MRKAPLILKYDFGVRCAEDNKAYMREYMRIIQQKTMDCECGKTIVQAKYTKAH